MQHFRVNAVAGQGTCTLVLSGEVDLAAAPDLLDLGTVIGPRSLPRVPGPPTSRPRGRRRAAFKLPSMAIYVFACGVLRVACGKRAGALRSVSLMETRVRLGWKS